MRLLACCSTLWKAPGDELVQDPDVARSLVGDDLEGRTLCRGEDPEKEPTSGAAVALGREQHVDHLAELVDRPVQVAPRPADLEVRLVDVPAVPHTLAARLRRLGQQRREALHPAEDGDVVDLDASLRQQLLHVP